MSPKWAWSQSRDLFKLQGHPMTPATRPAMSEGHQKSRAAVGRVSVE